MNKPMKIKFKSLFLICKKKTIEVPLSNQILFFHGKMGSGKSTIVRLIDYCLGSGKAPSNRAIDEELNSVNLTLDIGKNDVRIERDIPSQKINVSWIGPEESASVIAPIQGDVNKPIWKDTTCFNDLIFYLFGLKGIFLPLGATRTDSPIVRLSIRDILKFCYLPQDEMLSSFFRLDDNLLRNKSRNVMRLFLGRLTEKIAHLESSLNSLKEKRKEKERDALRLREFLKEFGFESEDKLVSQMTEFQRIKDSLQKDLLEIRKKAKSEPHPVDRIRSDLLEIQKELNHAISVRIDLENTLDKRRKLKNQIISLRVKGSRMFAADEILSGAKIELCPMCGLRIRNKSDVEKLHCQLCGRQQEEEVHQEKQVFQKEFESRINELSELIERLISSLENQTMKVKTLKEKKAQLEDSLNEREGDYDPKVIAFARTVERELGGISEKITALQKTIEMNRRVKSIEEETDAIATSIRETERQLVEERNKEKKAEKYITKIEELYIKSLLEVGLPGISELDIIKLDQNSWIPKILPGGNSSKAWSFGPDESAGKNTLLKTCYALTLHRVAALYNLHLPTLLIIDAPMDHVGKGVNKEIFDQFYEHLYNVADEELRDTQFVIIADEYVKPSSEQVDIFERYMTPDEQNHPPLITYWREKDRE